VAGDDPPAPPRRRRTRLLIVGIVVVLAGLMGYLFSSVWWTIGVLVVIPVLMFLDWYANRPGDRRLFRGEW
jgi:hypothetical protein